MTLLDSSAVTASKLYFVQVESRRSREPDDPVQTFKCYGPFVDEAGQEGCIYSLIHERRDYAPELLFLFLAFKRLEIWTAAVGGA